MVYPPHVIISFGVVRLYVAVSLSLSLLGRLVSDSHSCWSDKPAVPQGQPARGNLRGTLPRGLTHHTAQVLLGETLDQLLCGVTF